MNDLHLDLNMTNQCNFRCIYCFEHGKYNNNNVLQNPDLVIFRLKQLVTSDIFTQNFRQLRLSFWGGEPLLEFDVIKYICDSLRDYNVRFLLYTNGSLLNKYIDYFNDLKNITIQVSYDGYPIHDLCRIPKTINFNSNNILDIFKNHKSYKFDLSAKSTLPLIHLDKIYDAYCDVKQIMMSNCINNVKYMPTIDYCQSNNKIVPLAIYNGFKKGLLKIAKDEIEFYKQYNFHFFKWFTDNSRHLCSASIYLFGIDSDLSIYRCHGDFYNDDIVKKQLKITNLIDDDWFSKILDVHNIHKPYSTFEPPGCITCKTTYCMRCNSFKFRHSLKNTLLEKWYDYECQPEICSIFNLVGDIKRGVNKILGRY